MALDILRSQKARLDLLEIWQFIADDNEAAADALLDRFQSVLFMLSNTPKAGRVRPELGREIRSFPVGRYVLFYRIGQNAVELIRVLNSHLDIKPDDMDQIL